MAAVVFECLVWCGLRSMSHHTDIFNGLIYSARWVTGFWKTFKQDTISRSSTEEEYKAIPDTVQEFIWLKNILTTFGICFDKPITFYCDNISAIHMEINIIFHERTKPIGINYHFIRDKIVRNFVTTKHVSKKLQLVNIVT